MHFKKRINIGARQISEDARTFIIAEAGVNHNGDMNMAKRLIEVAVSSGADAVKFQNFKAESLMLKNIKKAPYQKKTTSLKESQSEMLKKLELSKAQTRELKKYCAEKGIIFLTTCFDEDSLAELDDLDLAAYKVASTDITNLLFLKKVAKKHKPIILSTGMAYLWEVEKALQEIYPYNNEVILLQCTANYPIKDGEANLRVISAYKEKFNMLTGYSDHSIGLGASPYAVAVGAKVIEKHFTLDKNLEGPDHKASLTPEELTRFVKEIRKVEKYLGSKIKIVAKSEIATRKSLQKCLVAKKQIKKGELFTEENIIAKRTGGLGLTPLDYNNVIGRKANQDFSCNEIIKI